jgi:hypothetical protein
MSEFKDKNDVWVFKDGQLKMLFTDLYSIKDSVKKLYPQDSKGKKPPLSLKPVFKIV